MRAASTFGIAFESSKRDDAMTKRAISWRLEIGDAGMLAAGRWFWPRVIAWTALLFGVTVGAFFAALEMSGWISTLRGHETAIALLVPAAMLGVYAIAVRLGERRPVSELRLSRAPAELAAGAAIGFTFISLALLLLWGLGLYDVRLGTWRDPWRYFVFNAYISAVLEELAFRAILLRLFARMFGPWPGLVLSAALFGLAHASHASPVAVLELIVNGGAFLGLLYLASGRLWFAIGAHVAYDFTEWSLMGVGDSDGLLVATPAANHPAWLTGGSFGPDGSVLTALVGALLTWSIVVAHRRWSR